MTVAQVVQFLVARLSDIWPPLCALLLGGSARPLGYPRAETPLPKEEWLPAGRERVGADTGPADSVDTDSGPSAAITFGPTNMLGGRGAADGAVSLGSTSLSANSLRARERVYGYAIADE